MKLRKPCQHIDDLHPEGHYEPHWFGFDFTTKETCPGGVFLPDDTLVIEPTEQGLREAFNRLVELGVGEFHDCAKYTEYSLVVRASDNARLKCVWVLPDALFVRETTP